MPGRRICSDSLTRRPRGGAEYILSEGIMKIVALLCVIALCPAAARAQDGEKKFEAFGGFSYFRAEGVGFVSSIRGPGFVTEPLDTNQRGWVGYTLAASSCAISCRSVEFVG